MPIKTEPQPSAIPTDSPLKSEPLAKVYAQQQGKKPSPKLIKKVLGVLATLLIIGLLAVVIWQLMRVLNGPGPVIPTPEPTPTDNSTIITGPVTRYATYSATHQIEEMIKESEEAFKNIRFREDAYLPPRIDLEVSL